MQFDAPTAALRATVGTRRLRRRAVHAPRRASRIGRWTASSSPTGHEPRPAVRRPGRPARSCAQAAPGSIFEAAAGDANTVTITQSGSTLSPSRTPATTLTGGGGCIVAPGTATCTSRPTAITLDPRHDARPADSVTVSGTTARCARRRSGNDTLTGGTATTRSPAATASDTLNGGGRHATWSPIRRRPGVTVNLSTTDAQAPAEPARDTIPNVENVTGSPQADTLHQRPRRERLHGRDRNSTRSATPPRAASSANLGAGTASAGDTLTGSRT